MSQTIVVPQSAVPRTFERSMLDTAAFLQSASRYYNDRWKLHEFDPSGIKLPPHQPGFGWGVLVPPASVQVTAQRLYNKLGERFATWKYPSESLDEVLDPDKEVRPPSETGHSHIIWCRDVVEADECHRSKSADQITEAKINGIGLVERLLLEDFLLYLEWIEHLDIRNATLCTGSRFRDGFVPLVSWSGELVVSAIHPSVAYGDRRTRQVISC